MVAALTVIDDHRKKLVILSVLCFLALC